MGSRKKNQTTLLSNNNSISTLADLTSGSDNFKFGGYGGPEVRVTSFAGQWGVLIGIRGGLLINRKFTIGIIGAGFAHSVKRSYNDSSEISQIAEINMEYGGAYLEYIWRLSKIFHFSIPIDLVVMGVDIKKILIEQIMIMF